MNKEEFRPQSHAALVGVFVEEIMGFVRSKNMKLDAVVVSSGPGSYTGLRIGVSEAKGLVYGLGIPLIALPTHLIMASMMKDRVGEDVLLCPMIDARRMEVYAAIFDTSLHEIRKTAADIVDEDRYRTYLDSNPVIFFGNGAEKCQSVIMHHNAQFIADMLPLASGMVDLGEEAFAKKQFVDSAYFEPFYLKEFVATVAKNKLV